MNFCCFPTLNLSHAHFRVKCESDTFIWPLFFWSHAQQSNMSRLSGLILQVCVAITTQHRHSTLQYPPWLRFFQHLACLIQPRSRSLITETGARSSHYPSPFLLARPLFPPWRQSETGNEINAAQWSEMSSFWLSRHFSLFMASVHILVFSVMQTPCQRWVDIVTQPVHGG